MASISSASSATTNAPGSCARSIAPVSIRQQQAPPKPCSDISFRSLRYRLEKLGIDKPDDKPDDTGDADTDT